MTRLTVADRVNRRQALLASRADPESVSFRTVLAVTLGAFVSGVLAACEMTR